MQIGLKATIFDEAKLREQRVSVNELYAGTSRMAVDRKADIGNTWENKNEN